MPRTRLGPWGKLYASAVDDTAHYTDRQFRAFIGIFCMAIRDRGELPKIEPLRALFGAAEVDFLVAQGRLVSDPNGVMVAGWSTYQAPVDRTAAKRQRDWYARTKSGSARVDNALANGPNGVSLTEVPTSTSTDVDTTDEEERPSASDAVSEDDPLDAFYLVTTSYPQSPRLKRWIEEVAGAGPSPRDFFVVFKSEYLTAQGDVRVAMSATKAKLARMTERAIAAREKRPKPLDPVQAQLREALQAREAAERAEVAPEPTPAEIKAGRAAWAALRHTMGRPTNGASHGPSRVLGSGEGGQVRTLTDAGTSGSPAPARGPGRSTPSSPDPAVRPAASGPPDIASTDEARRRQT